MVVGHGSVENPDFSTPYFDHTAEIRKRRLIAEVHCFFWKEDPSMHEVLYMIDAKEVYIVPDFISEGYFTREWELTGPTNSLSMIPKPSVSMVSSTISPRKAPFRLYARRPASTSLPKP